MEKLKILNNNGEPAPISLRDKFGQTLISLGKQEPRLTVLDADLSSSTKTALFGRQFPDRFFNVGIAEQNLIGISMGLAASSKIVIASGFTCFTVGRAWELIRGAAADKLPVKICTTHAGLSADLDGGTHQALEDLALVATIPGTTIFAPADPSEIEPMMAAMINTPGVCYLRLMRNKLPWIWADSEKTKLPPAKETLIHDPFIQLLYESTPKAVHITVCTTGSMSCYAPQLVKPLEANRYTVRLIHFGKIKPLDLDILRTLISTTDYFVSIEEHNIINGFGAQLSCQLGLISPKTPKAQLCLGIKDRFGQTGTVEELYTEYGLDIPSLTKAILTWLHQ